MINVFVILTGVCSLFLTIEAPAVGWSGIFLALLYQLTFLYYGNELNNLVKEWCQVFDKAIAAIGHAEMLNSPATGIYKEIDDLYLQSLDDIARGLEIQNRNTKMQLELQKRHGYMYV